MRAKAATLGQYEGKTTVKSAIQQAYGGNSGVNQKRVKLVCFEVDVWLSAAHVFKAWDAVLLRDAELLSLQGASDP